MGMEPSGRPDWPRPCGLGYEPADPEDQEAAEVFRLTWMHAKDRLNTLSTSSIRSWFEDAAEREGARITGLQ